jgi:hypothetical protein
MIETAPSGAYVEDWRLLPESRAFAAHLTKRDAAAATCLYVADEHVIYARNRTVDYPQTNPWSSSPVMLNTNAAAWRNSWIANSLTSNAHARRRLHDYGFDSALAKRSVLGYPWLANLASNTTSIETLALSDNWTLESLWCP